MPRSLRPTKPRADATPSTAPEALALDESTKRGAVILAEYEQWLKEHKRLAKLAVKAQVPRAEVAQRAGYTTRQLDRWLVEPE